MHAKHCLPLLVLSLLAVPAHAQESVRDLSGPGQHNKFLTPGQMDRWLFDGEKGETLIVHVVTREFDPVLELAKAGTKEEEKALLEVDDPGNESRFAIRLPDKGQYAIRVHAFKFQGGGNYSLIVQRFQAKPLTVGTPLVGTFDREGRSYHYFQGAKDQILIPEVKGAAPQGWQALDHKGRELVNWAGTVSVAEEGECCLILSGPADNRYDLVVRQARRTSLDNGGGAGGSMQQGEAEVLTFHGKPGEFRLLEVEKKGDVLSRLIYAPLERKEEARLNRPGGRPEIVFLPVASRGGRLRFAAILGREGRYQLQLVAQTPAEYKLTMRDPSMALAWGAQAGGNLPVGGTAFYSFHAKPGQLFQAGLTSQQFVPLLRLYDMQGNLLGSSSSEADALESRLTHMVVKEGTYRLQVSSLGDGGGGEYRQTLTETKLKELQIGARGQGSVQPGAMEFWTFAGEEGKTVFLSVRSSEMEPAVSLRSPDGVLLAADNRGNTATGSLIAIKLPRTGKYTVGIGSRRGAGAYTVRLIDGD
jgi:hypothetical protein